MAASRNTNEVLASARKDLEAQLAVVRDEIARLTAEEQALTHAVSNLDGGNPAMSAQGSVRASATARKPKRASRTRRSGRSRRRSGATKTTAERVEELRGLLADGPKSRNDLAAALSVSPPRVQQLLAELGGAVSSQPDPNQRRGKLWSLKGKAGAPKGKAAASKGKVAAK
jgi:hypothetical protein